MKKVWASPEESTAPLERKGLDNLAEKGECEVRPEDRIWDPGIRQSLTAHIQRFALLGKHKQCDSGKAIQRPCWSTGERGGGLMQRAWSEFQSTTTIILRQGRAT